ncbi:MAG: exo-alpha-sialidase [Armatimonadetes bacterium]|nr:exo-alpha-sialidase [Armatimonadota bacterium]
MPIALTPLWFLAYLTPAVQTQPPPPWQAFYEGGKWIPGATAWIGDGTRSQRTEEGLVIADGSTEKGSGRHYMLNWRADPTQGAALEAQVKAVSCSQPWGCGMSVADGVHEESLTIFPDRLLLVNAKREFPFDAAGGFHTYRLEVQGEDLRLFADDRLLFDGAGAFVTPAQLEPPRNQCGFGCGASSATGEAIWEWVRFRSALPEKEALKVEAIPGLKIELGEPFEIIPGAIYTSLFRFRDGRLAVGGKHSSDGGQTWTDGPGMGTHCFEFPDGEVIGLGFNSKKLADGVFEVPLIRSRDGGATFEESAARLNIPQGTGGTGDDGKYYEGPPVDHAIVQCRDGSLLTAMYGYFRTDTVLCEAFPPEWKLYKYRTWVMRSTDRGETWDYWATVAYDPNIGIESFCEADLLTLPSGDLLCFMRTGGSGPSFSPLYLSVSSDDGKTWETPRPIADRGVWPNACRMADGTLIVTYGRPDNWLAFSLDDGRTWVGHTCLYQGATTSYNSVEEVEPGKLLVVYDSHSLDADGNPAKGIRGQFVQVQRG